MFRSLATAASGMEAQQTKLDVTANNIANVSTNGFKKSRAEFADLMYQNLRPAGAPTGTGANAPTGTEIGLGTRLVSTARELGQGELHTTGNPLDIAIEGHGFLGVTLPTGAIANQFLTAARGLGLEKEDCAVLFHPLAKLSGVPA